jgi:hypothetical protein
VFGGEQRYSCGVCFGTTTNFERDLVIIENVKQRVFLIVATWCKTTNIYKQQQQALLQQQ